MKTDNFPAISLHWHFAKPSNFMGWLHGYFSCIWAVFMLEVNIVITPSYNDGTIDYHY
jgi:hypothetical protein